MSLITRRPALRLTLLYVLFALFWLFLLEDLLHFLTPSESGLTQFDLVLDLWFVLLTSAYLYHLLRRESKRRQEIEVAQNRLQALFDNALDAILLADDQGRYISVNSAACRLLGYSEEELLQMSVEDITPPSLRAAGRQQWARFLEEGHMGGEYAVLSQDGELRPAEFRAVAHVQPGLHLSILRDIAERKRAEEAIKQQNRALATLHEELGRYTEELERRVAERTAALREANERLQAEMRERQQAEAAERAMLQNLARHEERQRIARELHDTTSQSLWSMVIIADVLPALWRRDPEKGHERLQRLQQLAAGTLAEMRMLLVELRPDLLADTPLPDLLEQLTVAARNRTRAQIQLACAGSCPLPVEVQHVFYRIAQEALNNVVRHARATRVKLTLDCEPHTASLSIVDNGVGFEPTQIAGGHMGMLFMEERAQTIGASLVIESDAVAGTTIHVRWPGNESGKGTEDE